MNKITRRGAILAAAGAVFAPSIVRAKPHQGFLGAPKRFYKGGLYTAGKSTTLLMTGASDAWGVGLDQTQQYTTQMQSAIDATCSSPKGGWTCRNIQSDDFQPGIGPSGGYVINPFNCASPNEGPNGGTGAVGSWAYGSGYNTAASGPALNPQGGVIGNSPYNTAKLNWVTTSGLTSPSAVTTGIFGAYSGFKTTNPIPTSGGFGNWTPPGIQFSATGNNVRWAAQTSAASTNYIVIGFIGSGSVYVYQQGVGSPIATVSNSSASSITNHIVGPFSGNGSVQTFSMQWASGSVVLAVLWPTTNGQAPAKDMSIQISARDSHCVQDYVGNSPFTGVNDPGTGSAVTTLIYQSVFNNPNVYGSLVAPPIFLLQDTIANFLIGASPAYNGVPFNADRRLSPSNYVAALKQFGLLLRAQGPCQIILEMPCVWSIGTNGTWVAPIGLPNSPSATFTGSISGNTLMVSGVSGTIVSQAMTGTQGQTVYNASGTVPPAVIVSGAGSTWTLNSSPGTFSSIPMSSAFCGLGWPPKPPGDGSGGYYGVSDYQSAIGDLAENMGWYFLDQTYGSGSQILPGYPSAGQKGLDSTAYQFWLPDGVHMTPAGAAATATFMIGALGL